MNGRATGFVVGDSGDVQAKTIMVELAERAYAIRIGSSILSSTGDVMAELGVGRRVFVATNPVVRQHYYTAVEGSLLGAGYQPYLFEVPDGEAHKTLQWAERMYDVLIGEGFDRNCGLVALGGGVIGDLAGFVAATYLRGVPYIQVPTTLLAQVDSSVGGKTAVNHRLGKNLIGAFYQPRAVLIDVDVLGTLPAREVRTGLAEVVKYGVIRDPDFFGYLEEHVELIKEGDPEALARVITTSCAVKADVVRQDERESGLRTILNFGHTFAHAIESLTAYETLRHGEAVAIGMVLAAMLSKQLGMCAGEDVDRLRGLLGAIGLPTVPPPLSIDEMLEAMHRDKKVRDQALRRVLMEGLGSVRVKGDVTLGAIRAILHEAYSHQPQAT